jgi:integrase
VQSYGRRTASVTPLTLRCSNQSSPAISHHPNLVMCEIALRPHYMKQLAKIERVFGDLPLAALNWRAITSEAPRPCPRHKQHQHLPSIVSLARTRRRHAVAPVEEHLRHEWILVNGRRRPWAPNAFRKAWGASASRAGIIGLHFHDLGGTAVTRLSEAECTPQEIARFTGHSLRDVAAILDRYLARTDKLASAALAKLERARK